MLLQFHCPICRAEADSDSKFAGDWTSCPNCNSRIMIPCAPVGPDTKLGGYRIIKKIGSGGMGSVYLAEQKSMGRLVALKVLPPALTKNSSFIELFRKEILTQGSLSHNNIATAYDAGEDRGIYWLALEYVKGYTLQEMVTGKGSIPEKAALKIAMEVARGMDYAWSKQSMIHRDIKPSNIMVHEDKGVKILDLGLARSLREIAGQDNFESFVLGTPQYMPPEQLESLAHTDVRSDIYALGSTLYHALSGDLPYDEDTVVSMITMKIKEPPPPLATRNPKISAACVEVISKMMEPDADDRYQNWDELIQAIGPLLPRKGEGLGKKTRTNKWKPSYSITAMIALAGILALFSSREKPKSTPEPPVQPIVKLEIPATSTAPGAEATPQVSPQHQAIKELYAYAQERLATQPNAFNKNIELFQRLKKEAAENTYTKYELLAEESLERLNKNKNKAIMMEKTRLLESIQPALEEQNFDTAIDILKTHQSPHAHLLKDWKEQTLANFHAAKRQSTVKANKKKKVINAEYDKLLLFVAQKIIAEKNVKTALGIASTESERLADTDVYDSFVALTNLLEQASRPGLLIAQSFEPELGENLTLVIDGSPLPLTIDGISNRLVTATRHLDIGSIEVQFSSKQLESSEIAKRLDRLSGNVRPLLLGLLAADIGSETSAQNYFDQITHPVGNVLSHEWARLTDQRNMKVQKTLSDKIESEAATSFTRLLQWIGLEEESSLVEQQNACEEVELSSNEDRKILRLFLSRFLSQYGETELAEKNANLLQRLKEVSGLNSVSLPSENSPAPEAEPGA